MLFFSLCDIKKPGFHYLNIFTSLSNSLVTNLTFLPPHSSSWELSYDLAQALNPHYRSLLPPPTYGHHFTDRHPSSTPLGSDTQYQDALLVDALLTLLGSWHTIQTTITDLFNSWHLLCSCYIPLYGFRTELCEKNEGVFDFK